MIHSDRAIRLAMLASMNQNPGELNAEEQTYYDRVRAQAAAIVAQGGQVDLPYEAPDPD